jgi:hypothetical protein
MHGHNLCNKNMRQLAAIGCVELRFALTPPRRHPERSARGTSARSRGISRHCYHTTVVCWEIPRCARKDGKGGTRDGGGCDSRLAGHCPALLMSSFQVGCSELMKFFLQKSVNSFFEALSFFLRHRLPSGYISAVGVGGDWLRRAPLRSGSSLHSE